MIKALIFDWHGVLDNVTYADLVERLVLYSGKSKNEVRSHLDGFDDKYIRNMLSPEDFWSATQKKLGISDNQVEQARNFVNNVDKNKSLWDELSRLKPHYRLAILSDCPQEKIDAIKKTTDLSMFERRYFSAEKGITKHDPKFFTQLIADLQLEPSECLFIDDTEKHVRTAEKLGMQACHFTQTNDLIHLLTI